MTSSRWTERLSLLGVLALAGIVLAVFTFSDSAQEAAVVVLEWFEGQGVRGMFLFVAMYVVAVLLLVPAIFFTLGAGFVFGFWIGLCIVGVSMAISAPVAFLLARYAFGERVAKRVKEHPRLKRLNRSLRRDGWKIVLLSRLVPGFPFKLSNYFFGLTEIPLRGFFWGTMIGLLPLTVVNVYIGSLAGRLTELLARDPEPLEWWLYGVGLLAAIALIYQITRMARRAMNRAMAADQGR